MSFLLLFLFITTLLFYYSYITILLLLFLNDEMKEKGTGQSNGFSGNQKKNCPFGRFFLKLFMVLKLD